MLEENINCLFETLNHSWSMIPVHTKNDSFNTFFPVSYDIDFQDYFLPYSFLISSSTFLLHNVNALTIRCIESWIKEESTSFYESCTQTLRKQGLDLQFNEKEFFSFFHAIQKMGSYKESLFLKFLLTSLPSVAGYIKYLSQEKKSPHILFQYSLLRWIFITYFCPSFLEDIIQNKSFDALCQKEDQHIQLLYHSFQNNALPHKVQLQWIGCMDPRACAIFYSLNQNFIATYGIAGNFGIQKEKIIRILDMYQLEEIFHLTQIPDSLLSPEEKQAIALYILKMSGLVQNFSNLIVLSGHDSGTLSYSSFNCFASSGLSGAIHAHIATLILNEQSIRSYLKSCSIVIPQDTRFVAVRHQTQNNTLQLVQSPLTQAEIKLGHILKTITENGKEKSIKETGNIQSISCVLGSSYGINFTGLSFVHSYNFLDDPRGEWLEKIFDAPLKVPIDLKTNHIFSWIEDPKDFPTRLILFIQGNPVDILKIIENNSSIKNMIIHQWMRCVSQYTGNFYSLKNNRYGLTWEPLVHLTQSSVA